ncbi:glycosyltransferase [Dactylosporangium sp. CA-092794]|uniref:glycosyltransferase n=1 Tax=Dactylosporangium sp. CA-092794 TaxID=3239929 RepID=UPI003D945C5F
MGGTLLDEEWSPPGQRSDPESGPRPEVTIVVPTRNEADNVRPLVARLQTVLHDTAFEVVFVDDSDDTTPEEIRGVGDERVRLLHRPRGERTAGLGGAVVAGIAAARAPWVVVMDGDLQHPPETLPAILERTGVRPRRADDQESTVEIRGGADAVVATRYAGQGRADGLGGAWRRLVSRASGTVARLVFPRRLARVSDPMSGFFAVRRAALAGAALRPVGYKILLEILVRARMQRVEEVPYTFRPRAAGDSKASLREGLRFLRHLAGLRLATIGRPSLSTGRRSVRIRFALGVVLAFAAFPAVAVSIWRGLLDAGPAVPLVIPLLTGATLLVGRLKAADAEPDVHDRQVDGLIATALLLAAGTLTALAPPGGATSGWTLLGFVSFLAAATVLLLGTRTAARLRWALVLPLLAIDGATPDPVADALRGLGGAPAWIALLCLLLAALSCFGPTRRGALGVATALPVLTVVALAIRLLGGVPLAFDAALGLTVAAFTWRWSAAVAERRSDGRPHYVPRGRLAFATLAVAALLLGVPGSPIVSGLYHDDAGTSAEGRP